MRVRAKVRVRVRVRVRARARARNRVSVMLPPSIEASLYNPNTNPNLSLTNP